MFKFLLPLPSQLRRVIYQQARFLYTERAPQFRPRSPSTTISNRLLLRRSFRTSVKMSDLSIELTAPNGTKYTQPTGLFINNEWVKSSSGQKLTSINPTYALPLPQALSLSNSSVMNLKLPLSTQQPSKMSIPPSQPPERPSTIRPGAIWLLPTAATS